MGTHQQLVAEIDGRAVSRRDVLAWELGRARRVLSQLGGDVVGDDVDELRIRLLALKERMGPQALERRLSRKLRASSFVMRAAANASGSARSSSSVKIQTSTGSAGDFANWFTEQSALPYSSAMLAANPDHYLIGQDDQGRQKVIETTGGSPLPTLFIIDYEDTSTLRAPADPDYPVQIAGVARDVSGAAVGGVRHQFRDLDAGFEAWLTVEFPRWVPASMLRGHNWHLACEFGNWIEFAQTAESDR